MDRRGFLEGVAGPPLAVGPSVFRVRPAIGEPPARLTWVRPGQAAWQDACWGRHYPRLLVVKRRYDPDGLFCVHHGIGSENWSADGFTRIATP